MTCPEHKTKTMKVEWAEKMSRFTRLFEQAAIRFLEGSENRSKTAKALRISRDEMNHIMNRAVKRGLSKRKSEPIKYIGMDEKSFLSGQSYISVMTDIEGKRVLDKPAVKQNLQTSCSILLPVNKSGIEAISMDSETVYYRSRKTYTACCYCS